MEWSKEDSIKTVNRVKTKRERKRKDMETMKIRNEEEEASEKSNS